MYKKRNLLLGAGVVLVLLGLATFGFVKYVTNDRRITPAVFSNNALLLETWNDYKTSNIEAGSHRTLDKSQNNITTSEGESYTMLRAVWMDDKSTYDDSWQFTKNNLQRSDHLFSWKFGQRSDKSYGILTDIGGQNTASDADTDIALSLMMAYSRWNDSSYLYRAKQIINAIWDQEVITVSGKPVLVANDLEKNSQTSVVVNPSYFSPYSYKLFSKIDLTHNWQGLADNSYSLLSDLAKAPLDKSQSDGLPPNWILVDRRSGAFIPSTAPNLDTNYGYDAFRIPFRLALDYAWFKDPRDQQLLSRFSFLGNTWADHGSLQSVYTHDGSVVGDYETPAMYGASLGYFKVADTGQLKNYYESKLATLYSPDRQQWKSQLGYYDDNWAWFGIALYYNALPNLAEMNY